jgi:spermidine synthase
MLQPLVGRLLLPLHGGGFQVWTTCMLFFQLALLAGYAYAHLLLPRLGRRHRVLLLLSLPCAPLALGYLPARAGSVVDMLITLLLGVGLPFSVLATTSILAQMHLSTAKAGAESSDPYHLYAYSNAGSLLGLVSYPFLLEPWLGLVAQRALWAFAYVIYVALAWQLAPNKQVPLPPSAAGAVPPSPGSRVLYWVWTSASACAVLLGLTNVCSLGAGSIPLIWVLTLAAYLLGFVLAFSPGLAAAFSPVRFLPECLLLAFLIYAEPRFLRSVSEGKLLSLQLLALFWLTWCACAELYRTRPAPHALTQFYLAIACGGAIGGVLVSLFAPMFLRNLYEYPIALALLGGGIAYARRAAVWQWFNARTSWAQGARRSWSRSLRVLVCVALAARIVWWTAHDQQPSTTLRNFYGIYAIWDYDRGRDSDGLLRQVRLLSHNGTNHGLQSRRADERCVPTGYFHRQSALGELLAPHAQPSQTPRRAAVIGLGAGTISTYFDAQDMLTFYELDADTVTLARQHFDFLTGCAARPRIVIGDARIELARDSALPDHSLDLLILDAFSGDSIPFHLLTREAQVLYLRKLAPHGRLVFHVSSRFYDLSPIIASTARSLGLYSAHRTRLQEPGFGPLAWSNQYLVASRDAAYIDELTKRGWVQTSNMRAEVWTDDRASLLGPLWLHLMSQP